MLKEKRSSFVDVKLILHHAKLPPGFAAEKVKLSLQSACLLPQTLIFSRKDSDKILQLQVSNCRSDRQ